MLTGATVLVLALVRTLVVQVYAIPTGSMEPLLEPGDRVLVSRMTDPEDDVRRGDVVVFDGAGLFAPGPSSSRLRRAGDRVAGWVGIPLEEQDFVKRVIGLPGDRVACCDPGGAVTVDGVALRERYLPSGEEPSQTAFDVIVPPGRVWLMGDNRSASADSRAHLGDPGGGMVPWDRVVGPVVAVAWPPGRVQAVGDEQARGTPLEDGSGTHG